MNFFDKAFTSGAKPEPIRKSQGGISDYSEVTAEGVERVCGEFLSSTFNPLVTITYKSITFNTSCVNYFRDCQYFWVRIDEPSLRLIVVPTTAEDAKGLKVAYCRNGKNVPRRCTAQRLCSFLYDLMGWNPHAEYCIFPDFRGFSKRKFMVFNLDEYHEKQVVSK
jgi:hypothetical protein